MDAAPSMFADLYDDLHRLAERQLRRQGGGGLGATTLLHEAWLDMAGRDEARFPDESRFLAYAARVMRGVIIDHVRRTTAEKRGGGAPVVTLTGGIASAHGAPHDVGELERLSDALDELAALEPFLAGLVDLHFFCGYTHAEIAAMRGVSERTVYRDWRKARALLQRAVGTATRPPAS